MHVEEHPEAESKGSFYRSNVSAEVNLPTVASFVDGAFKMTDSHKGLSTKAEITKVFLSKITLTFTYIFSNLLMKVSHYT